MMNTLKLAFLATLLALSACTTSSTDRARVSADEDSAKRLAQTEEAQLRMDRARAQQFRSDSPWLGAKVVDRPKNSLPAAFLNKVTLILSNRQVTLPVAATEITRLTGIPVRISADVTTKAPAAAATALNAISSSQTVTAEQQQVWETTVDLNFVEASLSDILDQIAARIGISWEYRDKEGAIYFTRYVTKTFFLHVLPGTVNQAASVGKQGGTTVSGGAAFSATSSSSVTTDVNSWTTIEASIKSMLTEKGKMAISPATQTITVTDVRDTMERVESFIHDLNVTMTKQIAIKVDVISVTLAGSNELGLNWSAVYKNLASIAPNYSLTMTSLAAAGASSGGSMGLSVLAPTNGGAAGRWDGSTALFQALSVAGKASVLDTRRIVTLNNQPAPVAVTNQLSYVSSVTPGQLATTTSPATPATPVVSTLTTGYLLNIFPSVVGDKEMLLQFSVDISTLTRMNSMTTSGIVVQQPELSSTQFMQRARVKMGETVVLSGYARKHNQYEQRGMFSPDSYAFGGGYNGQDGTDELVIMITPVVTD